jgi:hypothetical protein
MSFNRWKLDLEERLALYLFNHPENEKVKMLPASVKRVVEVESIPGDRGWMVKLNGMGVAFFYSSKAHEEASSYAGKLANGEIPI